MPDKQLPTPKRVPSVTFTPVADLASVPILTRSRSSSHANPLLTPNVDSKRNHSHSISSVASTESTDAFLNSLQQQEKHDEKHHKNKVMLMDNVDIEKQLIITAGGKRENVLGFFCKLFFLMFLVFGSSVLIFYAL